MPIGYSPIAHGVASSAVYKHPATRCLVRSALVASTSCSAQRSFTPPENTRPISSFRVATVQNMGHHRGRRAQGLSLPPGWPPAGTRGPTVGITAAGEPKAYPCRPGGHRPAPGALPRPSSPRPIPAVRVTTGQNRGITAAGEPKAYSCRPGGHRPAPGALPRPSSPRPIPAVRVTTGQNRGSTAAGGHKSYPGLQPTSDRHR